MKRLKELLRKYSLLFLTLHRWRDAARGASLRRTPFFVRFPAKADVSMVNQRSGVCWPLRFIYFRIPKAANSTTFVRNPFARIVSAYLSKAKDSNKQKIMSSASMAGVGVTGFIPEVLFVSAGR